MSIAQQQLNAAKDVLLSNRRTDYDAAVLAMQRHEEQLPTITLQQFVAAYQLAAAEAERKADKAAATLMERERNSQELLESANRANEMLLK